MAGPTYEEKRQIFERHFLLGKLSASEVDTLLAYSRVERNPANTEIYATTDGRRFSTVAMLPEGLRYPAVTAVGTTVVIAGGQTATGQSDTVIALDTDIRRWLPGDAVYENTIAVPRELAPGRYPLRVGLLDPVTRRPAIQLAIAGRQTDGWYQVGEIVVY